MSVGSCRFGVLAAATFGYSCAAKQRRSAKSRDTLALTFDANQGRTRLHYKCVFYTGQRNPWVDEIWPKCHRRAAWRNCSTWPPSTATVEKASKGKTVIDRESEGFFGFFRGLAAWVLYPGTLPAATWGAIDPSPCRRRRRRLSPLCPTTAPPCEPLSPALFFLANTQENCSLLFCIKKGKFWSECKLFDGPVSFGEPLPFLRAFVPITPLISRYQSISVLELPRLSLESW
jgi:hypothetical protein